MKRLSRRGFVTGLVAVGLAPVSLFSRADTQGLGSPRGPSGSTASGVEQWLLPASAWVPNNQQMPVVLARGAGADEADRRGSGRSLQPLGWTPLWRGRPFADTHFHSAAHVLFAVTAGQGRMKIGGDKGQEIDLAVGDRLMLPAGTGQQLVSGSQHFAVTAFYPSGQCWDRCQTALSASALARMQHLPSPPAVV